MLLKFNFLKKSSFFLFIAFHLITSQAWGMKGEMEAEIFSLSKRIEIPSNMHDIGIKFYPYSNPITEKSWKFLDSYTDQTIENFKSGYQRGILLVHSLEDIMRATDSFLIKWNESHPNDRRKSKSHCPEDFHKVVSDEEFVNLYIEYVLAYRAIISCSLISFNDFPPLSLTSTFSPVNFIMGCSEKCINVTSRGDAFTPVYYTSLQGPIKNFINKYIISERCSMNEYLEKEGKERFNLDEMLCYPKIKRTKKADDIKYWNGMNEVAISSCTIAADGSVFRPYIKGVMINLSAPISAFNKDNYLRNQKLITAVKNYARGYNLPILEYFGDGKDMYKDDKSKETILEWEDEDLILEFEREVNKRIHETVLDLPKSLYEKDPKIIDSISEEICKQNPEFLKAWRPNKYERKGNTFLLSDEQLKGYGLKRGL